MASMAISISLQLRTVRLTLNVRGYCTNISPLVDPVFYLHHVQLDRLWWIWQQADSSRLSLYRGLYDDSPLSLQETLRLMGLTENKQVADVMNTESATLCYRY